MTHIRKVYKKDIPALFADTAFWNHSFLSVSKHRLLSHLNNPNLEEEDIVLVLAYLDDKLVGYMGVFTDTIVVEGVAQKIGWLSTWWVDPITKGTGVGREILNAMYQENKGQIGISQFTPSAKRVYDKSGYFNELKCNLGVKAVLRSNLQFVIPTLAVAMKKATPCFAALDGLINVVVNAKLGVQSIGLKNRLKGVTVEYVNFIDEETAALINRYNTKDIFHKSPAFFNWLKTYNWVLSAPLIELTQKEKYEFSMYDKDFEIHFVKVFKNQELIGFVVLQKRGYIAKVLFTYFDANQHADCIADVITLQNIRQNTREIICYDEAICNQFKKSGVFLYRTKKVKNSIISKVFNKSDFEGERMNFGDGDCCFA